jgi:hypothetical protein
MCGDEGRRRDVFTKEDRGQHDLLSEGYHTRYCAFEDGTSDGGAAEECMINGRRSDTDGSGRNFVCDGKLQKHKY